MIVSFEFVLINKRAPHRIRIHNDLDYLPQPISRDLQLQLHLTINLLVLDVLPETEEPPVPRAWKVDLHTMRLVPSVRLIRLSAADHILRRDFTMIITNAMKN